MNAIMNSPARVSISPTSVTETSKVHNSFFKRVSRRFSLKRRPKFSKRKKRSDKGSSPNVTQDIGSKKKFEEISPANTGDFSSLRSSVSVSNNLISPLNEDDFISAASPSSTTTPFFKNESIPTNLEAEPLIREDGTDTVGIQHRPDTDRDGYHSTVWHDSNESKRQSSFDFNDLNYDTVEMTSTINCDEPRLQDEGFCTPKSFVTTDQESRILPRMEQLEGRLEYFVGRTDTSNSVEEIQGTKNEVNEGREDGSQECHKKEEGVFAESLLHEEENEAQITYLPFRAEHVHTPYDDDDDQEEGSINSREHGKGSTNDDSSISIQYSTSAEDMIKCQRKGLRENMRVAIVAGVHKDKYGTLVKFTPKRVTVSIDNEGVRSLLLKSIALANLDHDNKIVNDEIPHESKKPIPQLEGHSHNGSKNKNKFDHENQQDFEKNMAIYITGGKCKGKEGIVTKVTEKMIKVHIHGVEGPTPIMKRNAIIISHHYEKNPSINQNKSEGKMGGGNATLTRKLTVSDDTNRLQRVIESSEDVNEVQKGPSRKISRDGESAEAKNRNRKHSDVEECHDLNSTNQINEEIRNQIRKLPKYDESMNTLCFPDRNKGGRSFGNSQIMKSRLSSEQRKADTFLSYVIGKRLQINEIPLNTKSDCDCESFIEESGSKFELLSVKIQSDTIRSFGGKSKAKVAQLAHVQVVGPDMKSVQLKDWLCRLGDFSRLTPRKLVARLELLQSPAYKFSSGKKKGEYGIIPLELSTFREIEENGHVGCGFICEELLFHIMGENATAKRTICIQVRIFIPMMGIFKGMLMKKKIPSGSRILLPSSMKKVEASKHPDRDEKSAILLICQGGVDQSQNCHYIGRLPSVNKYAKAKPPKSFKPKELSKMIRRLFQAVGVPKEIIDEYRVRSKRYNPDPKSSEIDCINHAFVRGVIDPTGLLPPCHVFLSGVKNEETLGKQLFVTRSPCIRASDGRLLKVVRSKPKSMDESSWNFLMDLPFGVIIFSKPKIGFKSTPELIANGDLDGDLYFCCWNKTILSHMSTDPIHFQKLEMSKPSSVVANEEIDWWEKGRERMMDINSCNCRNELISKLYKLSEEAADKNKEEFMRDPDAEDFAKAYNKALENGKHGTKIELPLHLHGQIPKRLQHFLNVQKD